MFILCSYLLFLIHSLSVKHCIGHWAYQLLVIAICFLLFFWSWNVALAGFPNNDINKEWWTQDEHNIFMQEYEKYGNNCMHIAKVLSTHTLAQKKIMLNVSLNKIWKQTLQQWNDIEIPCLPMEKHKSWSNMSLNNKNIDSLFHKRTKPKC